MWQQLRAMQRGSARYTQVIRAQITESFVKILVTFPGRFRALHEFVLFPSPSVYRCPATAVRFASTERDRCAFLRATVANTNPHRRWHCQLIDSEWCSVSWAHYPGERQQISSVQVIWQMYVPWTLQSSPGRAAAPVAAPDCVRGRA